MAAFLVNYQAASPQASAELDYMMTGFVAVALGERLWGLEIDLSEQELRDWLESQLGADGSAMVIQLRPKPSQITPVLSPTAADWVAQAKRREIQ